ncbi:MAG: DUF4097 family beta strand repeat-containing protein [Blastocatellia bacterium]
MLKRIATLLFGIALIGLGVFLFVAPGGSVAMQWLMKLWPVFLILAGVVRVFGYLIDRHPRSPVGGMMVVAIGGILLAANLRGDRSVLSLFSQYWFFLLLAFVVGRVLRQYTYRSSNPGNGKQISAFTPAAIAVMFLLVGGGLASNYLAKNRQHLNGFEFKLNQLGILGSRFNVEDEPPQQFAFSREGRVVISDFRGDIEIVAQPGSLPTARLIQHIRANNQEEANQVANKISLHIAQAGKNLSFSALANEVQHDFTNTLIVTLPPAQFEGVEVANVSGSVKLNGLRGALLVRNSKGLEIKGNSGNVAVENPQGAVELFTIQGNVSIEGSTRETNLGEIHGSVTVSANGGNVTVGESVGPVKLRAQNARVEIQSISSQTKLAANQNLVTVDDTNNSRVNLSNIQGSVAVTAERSRVEAENITGNLAIRTSIERIQVNEISGALKIIADNSTIEVEEANGSAEIETTEDVTVRGFRGAMTVKTASGSITLETDEKLAGNLKATSERGRIKVALPEDSDFKLDAGSERGHVRVRGFETESPKRQRQITMAHNAAVSSPLVVLRSASGDIELQSSGLALANRDDEKER